MCSSGTTFVQFKHHFLLSFPAICNTIPYIYYFFVAVCVREKKKYGEKVTVKKYRTYQEKELPLIWPVFVSDWINFMCTNILTISILEIIY